MLKPFRTQGCIRNGLVTNGVIFVFAVHSDIVFADEDSEGFVLLNSAYRIRSLPEKGLCAYRGMHKTVDIYLKC